MTILFFLVHPAHFHLFRNVIKDLKNKKHELMILIKTKDILHYLLKNEGWKHINISKEEETRQNKLHIALSAPMGFLKRQTQLAKIVMKKKPDLMVGTEWSITTVGRLFNIPSVIFNEDDTRATPENYIFYPFANTIVMPTCCDIGKWENKKITYQGYHEIAYLHPRYFQPNREILNSFNPNHERYFIIRLVKLTASHDIGKKGINKEILKELIKILSKKGKVFINSERELENEFEKYRIKINPNYIHHAIYYSDLFIGDSQTMVAEASVLGTPSIRYNDFVGKLSYLEELEHKYNLTFGIHTSNIENLYEKVEELLNIPNLKLQWQKRRQKMLSEKINVTTFMSWVIENYPKSAKIMKDDPNYQFKFK